MNTKPQDTLESGAQWVIKTIAPKDQQQLWMDHYRKNRNAWNVGVGALGGATVAALANGAANAFGGDDRGNGGGSSWGWLAPMALGAAGMWAWNKYGNRALNLLKRGEKTEQAARQAMQGIKAVAQAARGGANVLVGGPQMLIDPVGGAMRLYRGAKELYQKAPSAVKGVKDVRNALNSVDTPQQPQRQPQTQPLREKPQPAGNSQVRPVPQTPVKPVPIPKGVGPLNIPHK